MFEVGNNVRVKTWDDMANEFGIDHFGDIKCNLAFVQDMDHLCGKEFKIEEISEYDGELIPDYDNPENKDFLGWQISSDMVELVEGDMIKEV